MELHSDFRIGILGAGTVGLTFASFFEKNQVSYNVLVKQIPEPVESFIGHNRVNFKRDRFTSINEAKIEKNFDLIISTVKRYDLEKTVEFCNRAL